MLPNTQVVKLLFSPFWNSNSNELLLPNSRLISCSALPLIWIANHSTTLEIFDPEHRKTVVLVKDLLWPICQLILIFIIYFVRHWTTLHLVVGAMGLLGLPCFLILPESPRWLANNGQKEKAEEIFYTMAKWNKKQELSLKEKQLIRKILDKVEDASRRSSEVNLNILNMFHRQNLGKTLIMLLNWVTINVGSYTLLLNTTKVNDNYSTSWSGIHEKYSNILQQFLAADSLINQTVRRGCVKIARNFHRSLEYFSICIWKEWNPREIFTYSGLFGPFLDHFGPFLDLFRPFWTLFGPFWTLSGPFLDPFWPFFGTFLTPFWPFLDPFGPFLDPFGPF